MAHLCMRGQGESGRTCGVGAPEWEVSSTRNGLTHQASRSTGTPASSSACRAGGDAIRLLAVGEHVVAQLECTLPLIDDLRRARASRALSEAPPALLVVGPAPTQRPRATAAGSRRPHPASRRGIHRRRRALPGHVLFTLVKTATEGRGPRGRIKLTLIRQRITMAIVEGSRLLPSRGFGSRCSLLPQPRERSC